MISVRHAAERGHTRLRWLDSRHSFSFGDYYDPEAMGFRTLRVLNDDRVAPASGFANHPHGDMEIITYVVDGALEHTDSLGAGSVLPAGTAQHMSAGTGIMHSERNHSRTDPVHFLQVWILPERRGLAPGYEQKTVWSGSGERGVKLIVEPGSSNGALGIHQDAAIWAGRLDPGSRHAFAIEPGRHAWLQLARGTLVLNGHTLSAGDGVAVSGESRLEIAADGTPETAEFLFFDLG